MIIDMPEPKDMRQAIEKLFQCQQSTTDTLRKITEALDQLAVWMKMAESINVMTDKRLTELERKTDLIMRSIHFSQSLANLK